MFLCIGDWINQNNISAAIYKLSYMDYRIFNNVSLYSSAVYTKINLYNIVMYLHRMLCFLMNQKYI